MVKVKVSSTSYLLVTLSERAGIFRNMDRGRSQLYYLICHLLNHNFQHICIFMMPWFGFLPMKLLGLVCHPHFLKHYRHNSPPRSSSKG